MLTKIYDQFEFYVMKVIVSSVLIKSQEDMYIVIKI